MCGKELTVKPEHKLYTTYSPFWIGICSQFLCSEKQIYSLPSQNNHKSGAESCLFVSTRLGKCCSSCLVYGFYETFYDCMQIFSPLSLICQINEKKSSAKKATYGCIPIVESFWLSMFYSDVPETCKFACAYATTLFTCGLF